MVAASHGPGGTATGTATGVGGENPIAGLNLSGTTHTDVGVYNGDAWTFSGGTNYNDKSGTVNDLITAVLLFSQFFILRSWALLFLASGYLFTAPVALIHALTFPGLFSPTGLLGAGPQTTAWLFMIWHGGFEVA